MANFEQWINQDLQDPVQAVYSQSLAFSSDNDSILVGVHVTDGGEPATLSGSVVAHVIRSADGGTVTFSGTLSGSDVSAILPEACFAYPGHIAVMLQLVSGTTKTTLCKALYSVVQGETGTPIDPGSVVPDLDDLLAMLDEMAQATDAAEAAAAAVPAIIAPTFSASAAYTAGSYVYYNGALYRFTADHAAGAWVGTDATSVQLAPEVGDLKSAIKQFENGMIVYPSKLLIGWYIGYSDAKLYYGSAQASIQFDVEGYSAIDIMFDGGNKRRIGFSNSEPTSGMTLDDFATSTVDTMHVTNNGYKYLYVMFTDNYASTGGSVTATRTQTYYEPANTSAAAFAKANENMSVLNNEITEALSFADGFYSNTLYYNPSSSYQTSNVIEVESGERISAFLYVYNNTVSVVTLCDASGSAQSVGTLGKADADASGDWYTYTNTTSYKQYVRISCKKDIQIQVFKDATCMQYVRPFFPYTRTGKNVLFMGDSLTCLRDYPSLITDGNTNINIGVAGATFMRYTDSGNKGVSFYDYVTAMVNNDTSLQEEIISRYTDQRIIDCIQRFIDLDFSTIDIIVFWYGMNDYLRGKELGSASETDYSKVLPCVEYGLRMLSTHFPTVQLYCVGNSYTDRSNSLGLTPMDYADAVRGECEKYAIPFYDMYHFGGVNALNYESRLEDGIHQNAYQNQIIAYKVANFINV